MYKLGGKVQSPEKQQGLHNIHSMEWHAHAKKHPLASILFLFSLLSRIFVFTGCHETCQQTHSVNMCFDSNQVKKQIMSLSRHAILALVRNGPYIQGLYHEILKIIFESSMLNAYFCLTSDGFENFILLGYFLIEI